MANREKGIQGQTGAFFGVLGVLGCLYGWDLGVLVGCWGVGMLSGGQNCAVRCASCQGVSGTGYRVQQGYKRFLYDFHKKS